MHAATFAALGEPSRLRIVELLRARAFAVNDIADALGIRQPQVSKHLKVLKDAGLVDVEADARRRIYRLRAEAFEDLESWVGSFEATWHARLDRLGDVLHDTRPDTTDTP